jgi:hypothetical protein
MAMDWSVLWSIGGALAGWGLGSYWAARRAESGKIDAITLKVDAIVKQEFEKARAIEGGRRLATHEDVQNVLAEVRVVTRETETIKARISDELWNKQKRLELKVSVYQELLGSLGRLVHVTTVLDRVVHTPPEKLGRTPEWREKEMDRLMGEYRTAGEKFHEAASFGMVAVPPEAVALFGEYDQAVPNIVNPSEFADYFLRLFGRLRVIAAADLGFRPDFTLSSDAGLVKRAPASEKG